MRWFGGSKNKVLEGIVQAWRNKILYRGMCDGWNAIWQTIWSADDFADHDLEVLEATAWSLCECYGCDDACEGECIDD